MIQAVRVIFANSKKQWCRDEVIVYADGFNAENTTQTVAETRTEITTEAQAIRHARAVLAEVVKGDKNNS